MLLEEAQTRLKKTVITQEELDRLNSLYIILDIHKDDFCRVVDTVGLDSLLKKQPHYDRILRAEEELTAKERYLQAQKRLEELAVEKADLEQIISGYRPIKQQMCRSGGGKTSVERMSRDDTEQLWLCKKQILCRQKYLQGLH